MQNLRLRAFLQPKFAEIGYPSRMKRFLGVGFMCLAASLSLSGCMARQINLSASEPEKTTIRDENGNEVTVDPKTGTVTSKGKDGSNFSMGTDSVTEEKLGLPFYPGSTAELGMSSNNHQGESVSSFRKHTDGVDKVREFYRSKLNNVEESTQEMSGAKVLSMRGLLSDGREVAISAMEKDGQTSITISVQKLQTPTN